MSRTHRLAALSRPAKTNGEKRYGGKWRHSVGCSGVAALSSIANGGACCTTLLTPTASFRIVEGNFCSRDVGSRTRVRLASMAVSRANVSFRGASLSPGGAGVLITCGSERTGVTNGGRSRKSVRRLATGVVTYGGALWRQTSGVGRGVAVWAVCFAAGWWRAYGDGQVGRRRR